MTKNLKKQIKAYAGIAGTLLTTYKASAQLVYVDVNPDTLIEAIPCDSLINFIVDIDQDALVDFKFKVKSFNCTTSWAHGYVKVAPYSNNKINNSLFYISSLGFFPYPQMLHAGDTINNNGTWLSIEKPLVSAGDGSAGDDEWHYGHWVWGQEGCLPFLLFKNSQNYYGWMHIKVLSWSSFILKEYAYQTQPNVPVLACDTTNLATNISEYNNPQFNFFQQNNSIHISTFQKFNHAYISVYDLLGKKILQQPFEGKETIIKIDKKGIYFVEVKSEKGIFRRKVFIY
jgi:hypothetical protein